MKAGRILLEDCDLQAVISMAGGFFQPYSGVGTAVLVFVKGGKTEKVWFYDMKADGYTVDLKRDFIDGKGDMPDIIRKFNGGRIESEPSILVSFETIKKNDYNLSISRYREVDYEQTRTEDPKKVVENILRLEEDIVKSLAKLKDLM